MDRRDINFYADGDPIAGWFYPPRDASSPAIVMAHGYSAVKEQYLDNYAEVFAKAGFAVLVFDHACFGASGGTPRQQVDPERQRRGYRDAITWVKNQTGIDADRIGIWGSSFSGGHVLAVAALDRRVKAVVAQVPMISGSKVARRTRGSQQATALSDRLREDRRGRIAGEPSGLIPVVAPDEDSICALPGPEAHAFFSGSQARAPRWRNEVTLRSIEFALENEPAFFIPALRAAVLIIVSEGDSLTRDDLAEDAFEQINAPKKLVRVQGGHFSPYVEQFATTSAEACAWFSEHLR
jgi:dienelactone hydrolase